MFVSIKFTIGIKELIFEDGFVAPLNSICFGISESYVYFGTIEIGLCEICGIFDVDLGGYSF
jgi:hypothetical protein